MSDVWIVVVQRGSYSETEWRVDSVWRTEDEAVSHIVGDYGATLSDGHSLGRLVWELDRHTTFERFGDYRRLMDDDETYEIVPRAPMAPDWYEGYYWYPTLLYTVHSEVS